MTLQNVKIKSGCAGSVQPISELTLKMPVRLTLFSMTLDLFIIVKLCMLAMDLNTGQII